jgi:hypothetical protein
VTNQDKGHFKRMLTKLGGVFLREVNTDLIDSYFTALRALPIHSVEVACRHASEEMQFFPKPVELRSLAPAPSNRATPREVNGELVYECFRCRDQGVELVDRTDAKGMGLGTFARPCLCPAGESTRRSWESPNSIGDVFADSARKVSAKLREAEATEKPA